MTVNELTKQLDKYKDKTITLNGWVRSNRAQKEFGFIMLNDGTKLTNTQVVYDLGLINFKEIQKASVGSSIEVEGKVFLTPDRKQTYEIHATKLTIIKDAGENFPIQAKRHSREFLREQAYLRPRTNLFNAIFRTRSVLAFAVHQFFQEKGFIYTHTDRKSVV